MLHQSTPKTKDHYERLQAIYSPYHKLLKDISEASDEKSKSALLKSSIQMMEGLFQELVEANIYDRVPDAMRNHTLGVKVINADIKIAESKNIGFHFGSIIQAATKRPVKDIPLQEGESADRTEVFEPTTQKIKKRKTKTVRGTPCETIFSKKTSLTLWLNTSLFGYNYKSVVLYDLSLCLISPNYIFAHNMVTNSKWWIKNSASWAEVIQNPLAHKSITFSELQAYQITEFNKGKQSIQNEILGKIPLIAVLGTQAVLYSNNEYKTPLAADRLNALLLNYIFRKMVMEKYNLKKLLINLPIYLALPPTNKTIEKDAVLTPELYSARPYSIPEQIEDIEDAITNPLKKISFEMVKNLLHCVPFQEYKEIYSPALLLYFANLTKDETIMFDLDIIDATLKESPGFHLSILQKSLLAFKNYLLDPTIDFPVFEIDHMINSLSPFHFYNLICKFNRTGRALPQQMSVDINLQNSFLFNYIVNHNSKSIVNILSHMSDMSFIAAVKLMNRHRSLIPQNMPHEDEKEWQEKYANTMITSTRIDKIPFMLELLGDTDFPVKIQQEILQRINLEEIKNGIEQICVKPILLRVIYAKLNDNKQKLLNFLFVNKPSCYLKNKLVSAFRYYYKKGILALNDFPISYYFNKTEQSDQAIIIFNKTKQLNYAILIRMMKNISKKDAVMLADRLIPPFDNIPKEDLKLLLSGLNKFKSTIRKLIIDNMSYQLSEKQFIEFKALTSGHSLPTISKAPDFKPNECKSSLFIKNNYVDAIALTTHLDYAFVKTCFDNQADGRFERILNLGFYLSNHIMRFDKAPALSLSEAFATTLQESINLRRAYSLISLNVMTIGQARVLSDQQSSNIGTIGIAIVKEGLLKLDQILALSKIEYDYLNEAFTKDGNLKEAVARLKIFQASSKPALHY